MVTKSFEKYAMLIEYAARIFVILLKKIFLYVLYKMRTTNMSKYIYKLLFVVGCLLLRMSDSEKILTRYLYYFKKFGIFHSSIPFK